MINTCLFQMLTFAFCKRKLSRQVTNFKIKSYHKNTSNYQSQQNNRIIYLLIMIIIENKTISLIGEFQGE